MEGCAVLTGSDDGVVGLVLCVALEAGFEEDGFELGLVAGLGSGFHDGDVAFGGDGVGFAEEGDFVVGFGDAAGFDGELEEVEGLLLVGEEGDVV